MHGTGTRAVDVDKWKNGKEVQPHSQGQVMLVGVFLRSTAHSNNTTKRYNMSCQAIFLALESMI